MADNCVNLLKRLRISALFRQVQANLKAKVVLVFCEHKVDVDSAQGRRVESFISGFRNSGYAVCLVQKVRVWSWVVKSIPSIPNSVAFPTANRTDMSQVFNLTGGNIVAVLILILFLIRAITLKDRNQWIVYFSSTSPSLLIVIKALSLWRVKILVDLGEWQKETIQTNVLARIISKARLWMWRESVVKVSSLCIAISKSIREVVESQGGKAIVIPSIIDERCTAYRDRSQLVLPTWALMRPDVLDQHSLKIYCPGTLKRSDAIERIFLAINKIGLAGETVIVITSGNFSLEDLVRYCASVGYNFDLNRFCHLHLGMISFEEYCRTLSFVDLVCINRPHDFVSNLFSFPTRVLDTISVQGALATCSVGDISIYLRPGKDYVDLKSGSVEEICAALRPIILSPMSHRASRGEEPLGRYDDLCAPFSVQVNICALLSKLREC